MRSNTSAGGTPTLVDEAMYKIDYLDGSGNPTAYPAPDAAGQSMTLRVTYRGVVPISRTMQGPFLGANGAPTVTLGTNYWLNASTGVNLITRDIFKTVTVYLVP